MTEPRCLAKTTSTSVPGAQQSFLFLLFLFLYKQLALSAKSQIFARFFVKALALGVIEDGFTEKPQGNFGPEIELAVEALHPIHQFSAVKSRILIVRQLVAGFVRHYLVDGDQAVLLDVVVEFSAWERMADGNLNRFDIQLLGEIDALANGLAGVSPGSPTMKSP